MIQFSNYVIYMYYLFHCEILNFNPLKFHNKTFLREGSVISWLFAIFEQLRNLTVIFNISNNWKIKNQQRPYENPDIVSILEEV